jgi:SAM-dependent methyltransferase
VGTTTAARPYLARPLLEDELFRRLRLWQCGECLGHFAVPRPSGAALAQYYARAYRADGRNVAGGTGFPNDHPWYLSRGLAVARLLHDAMDGMPVGPDPVKVLEIGAGYGHPLFALRRTLRIPLDVTAIEPDSACHPTLATVAERVLTHDVTAQTTEVIPKGPFGIAMMLHVLEHLAEPHAFLMQLREWMEPGGLLAVEVPNSPAVRVARHAVHVPHLHFFTEAGLAALLTRSGLELRSIGTYGPSYDEQGDYDSSFTARSHVARLELEGTAVPLLPFPSFVEAGPNRLFLRAIAAKPR